VVLCALEKLLVCAIIVITVAAKAEKLGQNEIDGCAFSLIEGATDPIERFPVIRQRCAGRVVMV
jgi:hypothetical protein